jgi:hypothetical protein
MNLLCSAPIFFLTRPRVFRNDGANGLTNRRLKCYPARGARDRIRLDMKPSILIALGWKEE